MVDGRKAVLILEKLTKGRVKADNKAYAKWDEIPLRTDNVSIGRPSRKSEETPPDISITGNQHISRKQASIVYSPGNGCFMIRDTSMNGTFLNGRQLETNRPYPLKDYDLIHLVEVSGESGIIFRFRDLEGTRPLVAQSRARVEPGNPLTEQGLSLDPASRSVRVKGNKISLTGTQYDVMEVLWNKQGGACSIGYIYSQVWGSNTGAKKPINTRGLVAQYISRLRKKIEPEPSKPRYLITVPGRHGHYQLVSFAP
jgi:pSer/pThr/pTyr-binding forkhead associated (FHA) protein